MVHVEMSVQGKPLTYFMRTFQSLYFLTWDKNLFLYKYLYFYLSNKCVFFHLCCTSSLICWTCGTQVTKWRTKNQSSGERDSLTFTLWYGCSYRFAGSCNSQKNIQTQDTTWQQEMLVFNIMRHWNIDSNHTKRLFFSWKLPSDLHLIVSW